jgi:structure-specific recognition protein 1
MLIPRGKYTMDMYENYAKFHGRTHDYKIMYNEVKKVFQLPRADTLHMAIVI